MGADRHRRGNQDDHPEGIFAGGDAVTGPNLVVTAMRAGREAAKSIHEYIEAKPH